MHVFSRHSGRTLVALLGALLIAVSGLAAGVIAAHDAAAATPPWEPVGNPPQVGGLTFYNAAGTEITSGSTAAPLAAYIQGTALPRSGDTLATLEAFTPVNGVPVGQWNGEGVSGTTAFPNASAPAALASSPLPLVTGSDLDYSLADYIGDFPNNDTSSDGYAGLYVLRLFTSAPEKGSSTTYDSADISISGTTWTLVYTQTPTTTPTTTTLSASPASPQPSGTPVTLTATVSPAASGTVQFEVGTTDIGSPVTVTSGVATAVTSTLPSGDDSLSAVFTPTAGNGYTGSTGTATYTIQATPTTTTLSASPASPQPSGTPVTLTATVSPAASGTVQFEVGTTDIGSPVTVTSGVATAVTSTLPSGDDSLSAVFTPTAGNGYTGSTGTATYTIQATPTTTTLSASPDSPQPFGTPVTLTATVSPAASGTVQFEVGTTDIGSPVTVTSGVATAVTSTLPVGTDSLSAVFTPTPGNGYAGSTGTASYTIQATPTTTTLSASPASPQPSGTPVTLTATVSPAASGTVQFEVGTTDIGSPVTVTSGVATAVTSTLPVGTDSLSAVFTPTPGNGYAGSTGTASFTVAATTGTTLTASPPSPQEYGTAVTLTATVSPSAAAGNVQFEDGTTDIGSPVTVTSGVATAVTTTPLPVGTHSLHAVFTPTDPDAYSGSTGTSTFVVTGIPTTTTLAVAPASPRVTGTKVTLTATVSPSAAAGTVQFAVGSTDIGSPVTVTSGTATYQTTTLPVGTDVLRAVFRPTSGSGYAGSIGTASFTVTGRSGKGYWLVAADGGIFAGGDAGYHGSTGGLHLNAPIVGIAATPDGKGYWLVAADGGIFAFGDAGYHGSTGGLHLNAPIVGIAATPDGKGYWLVAADGGIFAGGDAGYHGSTGGLHLNAPIVGIAATPDGKGYWLVAADGGIFAFGDAGYHGSTGGLHLNAPIVGIAATPDGKGYWLVAADGGIFAFGDAGYHGSTGGLHLNAPIVGIAATPDGKGYWLVAADGGIFAGGDAGYYGSAGGLHLNAPIVGMAGS